MMNVKISFFPAKEVSETAFEDGSTVEDMLRSFGINPDGVVVTRKGVPVPVDELLEGGVEFRIIRVVSGG